MVTDSTRTRAEAAARGLRRRQRALSRSTEDILTRALYQDRISRLEALASFSRPAQVADRAVAPETPISPKPVRDGLLGALLGLTIGILAAFVRDALDRRLRSVGQIQEELKLPVVGRVRDEALGRSGPVANGRGAMEEADLEAFRILRANLAFLDVDRPIRSLVVTSPLEGEGKSTVAISLAFANAWAGQRTLLVECDLRRPVLSQRLELKEGPGLADFLAGNATPQEIVQGVPVAPPASTNGAKPQDGDTGRAGRRQGATPGTGALACIVAGTRAPRPAELLASERFAQFLSQVSEVYDAVILDTAPMLSVADTLGLVARADGVLVCVRSQRTTRDQVRAARAALDRLPERPAALVVTGVKRGDESEYGYYYSDARHRLTPAPWRPVRWAVCGSSSRTTSWRPSAAPSGSPRRWRARSRTRPSGAILGRPWVARRMGVARPLPQPAAAARRLLRHYRLLTPALPARWRPRGCPDGRRRALLELRLRAPVSDRERRARSVCYCHSPLRFAWSMTERYRDVGAPAGAAGPFDALARRDAALRPARAAGVTRYLDPVAVRRRPDPRFYGREADVIGAPVDCELFHPRSGPPGDYFLFCGRLIEPYKRAPVVLEAFRRLPAAARGRGRRARAPRSCARRAPANVEFTGHARRRRAGRADAAVPGRRSSPAATTSGSSPSRSWPAGGRCSPTAPAARCTPCVPGVTGELFAEQTPEAVARGRARRSTRRATTPRPSALTPRSGAPRASGPGSSPRSAPPSPGPDQGASAGTGPGSSSGR